MGCLAPQNMRKIFPKCPGPRDMYSHDSTTGQAMAPMCPWCRKEDRSTHFDPVRLQAHAVRMEPEIQVSQRPENRQPAQARSMMTRWFLASLYVDSIGRPASPDSLAFCVAGSLARLDAAPLSDIDCFVILKDPSTAVRMKAVGKVFKKKLRGAMPQDPAPVVDPLGIDPVALCDGPAEIRNLIVQRNMDRLVHPLLNAQVAFGNRELLSELCDLLKKSASPDLKAQGLSDLQQCVHDCQPSRLPESCGALVAVDLERDLARPLALCVNGLARYNGIDVTGVRAQAHELRTAKVVSAEVHEMIIACSEVLERIRAASQLACLGLHTDTHDVNNDAEAPGELTKAVAQVRCLQHMASRYLEWLDSGTPVIFGNVSPFLTKSPATHDGT
jgi:hypothetical protein